MQVYVGVAFNHHDSSVTISDSERVILVLEAERYFREKKKCCTAKEMDALITVALAYCGSSMAEVAGWAMATLNNQYLPTDQRYVSQYDWRDVTLFGEPRRVLLVNHHYAHAATAYALSTNDALISSCDGGGDAGERNVFYRLQKDVITPLPVDTSRMITGKFYDVISQFLYGSIRCEGKLMALAALGNFNSTVAQALAQGLRLLSNESYEKCFAYLRQRFPQLAGAANTMSQEVLDFATTTQRYFERERLKDILNVVQQHPEVSDVMLVGGAALNITLNSMVAAACPQQQVLIPPCADDTGQSLGAILTYGVLKLERRLGVPLPFLSRGSREPNISDKCLDQVAAYLEHGEIIAWHCGAAEIGPRALGHRSFLAAATSQKIKEDLSEKVKRRESYRPVAPIVLESMARDWFHWPNRSPYMLFSSQVRADKLSQIPGAAHCDGSARIQTVTMASDPIMCRLLTKYYERTGIPLLLNTSLNLQGEPLSDLPEHTIAIGRASSLPVKIFIDGQEQEI